MSQKVGSKFIPDSQDFPNWTEKKIGKFFTKLFQDNLGIYEIKIAVGLPVQINYLINERNADDAKEVN